MLQITYRGMLIISLPMEGYRTITGQVQASLQHTLSGCCQAWPNGHMSNILSKSLCLSQRMQVTSLLFIITIVLGLTLVENQPAEGTEKDTGRYS